MATLRNKRNLAAINKDNHADHPRNEQARDRNVPRNQEGYITQVSEEIEDSDKENVPGKCLVSVGQKSHFGYPVQTR